VAGILIVDDSTTNLQLMEYLMRSFGYQVTCVRNAAEALTQVRQDTYELVLTDIQMAGMDGYEFLRRLKGEGGAASLPVIAVTALAMAGDRERALLAGFDGYITKPIDPMRFQAQVEGFLPPPRP
jgi:CheY-like chemotaxis protein